MPWRLRKQLKTGKLNPRIGSEAQRAVVFKLDLSSAGAGLKAESLRDGLMCKCLPEADARVVVQGYVSFDFAQQDDACFGGAIVCRAWLWRRALLGKGGDRGQGERECCDSGLSRACSHALFLAIWLKASGISESATPRASFSGTGLGDSPTLH